MLSILMPSPTRISFADHTGHLFRYADFPSRFVAPRHVDVWLPPGYGATDVAAYPVLYMHDGQNLFDPASAYAGVDWGIDEALVRLHAVRGLHAEGLQQVPIVVGIWNNPANQRWREYMPQKPYAALPAVQQAWVLAQAGGPPYSDAYLQFLVEEIKPFIDAHYRTRPEQPATCIMGSSMGGLISLYALCEYPTVFGGAACVSTHWPAGGPALVTAMAKGLPPAGQHRVYFDYGTATLDEHYEPLQNQMDALLPAAGYTLGRDWRTEKFVGAEHSERSWRERVHIPLGFLFG